MMAGLSNARNCATGHGATGAASAVTKADAIICRKRIDGGAERRRAAIRPGRRTYRGVPTDGEHGE